MRSFLVLVLGVLAAVLAAGTTASAQPTPMGSKTVFIDSDGNRISNDEFVDIRMANFHLPDRTLMKTHEDGTVEFRLQKVPQEGMQLPDLAVQTLDGDRITSADLKGKVTVVSFWFIGCPVCLAQKPKLNEIAGQFSGRDDVVFLAMTADRSNTVKGYLTKEKFVYKQATDAGTAISLFGFVGYPKNLVISRTGEIVYWRSTIKAWDKFESVIRTELAR